MKLPQQPPPLRELVKSCSSEELVNLIASGIGQVPDGRYLHWDETRFRTPPENVTREVWWLATKFRRLGMRRTLPLRAKDGQPFFYTVPDFVQEALHRVDQDASGRIEAPGEVANPHTRDRYLVNSLIEESITSSQLEGASTTRQVAKAMLREGRNPRDRSETMIFNNYRAMQFVRGLEDEQLTPELLLELHSLVTRGTLDDPSAEGRFRTASDNVAVVDARDNTVLHVPPDASELERRIRAICDFANATISTSAGEFVHPVVRSILLHFMIGYDHPFLDGNGRTARALFYWSMARSRYWMIEFVSISTIIRRAPSQYARAYLYSESDDNDTTYFLDFNLRIIRRAIENLHQYIARKSQEIVKLETLLGASDLNHRQLALLTHALRHPGSTYTMESHRKSHKVTYQTARTDLLKLVSVDLLTMNRRGKAYVFRAPPDIASRIGSSNQHVGASGARPYA